MQSFLLLLSFTYCFPPSYTFCTDMNWMERPVQLGGEKLCFPLRPSSLHPFPRYPSAISAHPCRFPLETRELDNQILDAGLGIRRGERKSLKLLVVLKASLLLLLVVCGFTEHLPCGLPACGLSKTMQQMSNND